MVARARTGAVEGAGLGVAVGPAQGLLAPGPSYRSTNPDEDLPFARGHSLHLDELFGQLVERVVIEAELALQPAQGDPTLLFQVSLRSAYVLQKAHRLASGGSASGFYALRGFRSTRRPGS